MHTWQLMEHPWLLFGAVIISVPFVWVLAKAFFPNIEQDLEDDSPPWLHVLSLGSGRLPESWILVKLVYLGIAAFCLVALFYWIGQHVIAWFA